MKITCIDLTRNGFGKILGDLELELMECLWKKSGEVSARDVTNCLNVKREISFNAVSTVLNRLCDKGFICKNANGKRYTFYPLIGREEMAEAILEAVGKSFAEDDVLSGLCDVKKSLSES